MQALGAGRYRRDCVGACTVLWRLAPIRGMPESSEGRGIECGAGMRVKVEGALCDQLVC